MLAARGYSTHTRGQGLQGTAAWLHVRPHPILLCLPLQGCLGSSGGGPPRLPAGAAGLVHGALQGAPDCSWPRRPALSSLRFVFRPF